MHASPYIQVDEMLCAVSAGMCMQAHIQHVYILYVCVVRILCHMGVTVHSKLYKPVTHPAAR